MGIMGAIYGRVTKISELPTSLSGIVVFAPGTYGARCAYYAMQSLATADPEQSLAHAAFALKQGAGMLSISASMALGILLSRIIFGRF